MTPPDADPAAAPTPQDLAARDLAAHGAFLRGLAAALLGDAAAAEDVAQESLLALHSAPRDHVRDPRAWTARAARFLALKRRRGEARRAARERAAARPESPESPEGSRGRPGAAGDPDPRAKALASVTAAVLALDTRYRDVVLARFFEGLSPSAIAAREAVPLATVKSRLARALERLRAALDEEQGGDRRAWSLGLAALAGRDLAQVAQVATGGAATAGSGAILGGIIVSLQSKIVLVSVTAALVAIVLVGGRLRSTAEGDGARTVETVPAPALVGERAARDVRTGALEQPHDELVAPPAGRARETAASPVEAPTAGDLVVDVAWFDGTPAAGLLVRAVPGGNEIPQALVNARTLVADARGQATFAELPPGQTLVRVDRRASTSAEVEAGRAGADAVHARIDLARAMDIVVRVVDARGNRVAGAEVWMSSAFRVGTSDASGELFLRSIDDQIWLCARKAGFGPSWMRRPAGHEGDAYTLELALSDLGGALDVVALGADGVPLAGALVQVTGEQFDPGVRPESGNLPFGTGTVEFVTDEDGRCAASSLAPGRLTVLAAAAGYAPLSAPVDVVAGATASVVLRFDAGFRVEGTVLDRDGTPLAGVPLRAGEYQLLGASTSTDAEGRYAFPHLPAGVARLYAIQREVGRDDVELEGAVGDVLEWNPVIDPGDVLALRFVDAEGAPIAGWRVNVSEESTGAWQESVYRMFGTTGEDGRFRAVNVPDAELVVAVYSTPSSRVAEALFPGLRASGDEVELVVHRSVAASAYVGGRTIDEDGRPFAALVWLAPHDGASTAPGITSSPVDGRFEFGPLPEGDYSVWFGAINATTATRDLTLVAGERRDLGDVVVAAPGRLVLDAAMPDGLAAEEVYVLVFEPGRRSVRGQGSLAGLARGIELSPGSYSVDLLGLAVPETHDVEVAGGKTTHLAVAPRRAAVVTLRFTLAPGVAAPGSLEVTLTGETTLETRTVHPRPHEEGEPASGEANELFAELRVAPDEPLFARFTGDGVSGEAWITREALDPRTPADAHIDVTLTR